MPRELSGQRVDQHAKALKQAQGQLVAGRVNAEQIWTVLDGTARVEIDGVPHDVAPGDTLVLPAGTPRRVHAEDTGLRAVAAPAGARATPTGGDPVLPPWIA